MNDTEHFNEKGNKGINITTTQQSEEDEDNISSVTSELKLPESDFNLRKNSYFFAEDSNFPITIIGPDNIDITPDDIIVSPDGGWGWVVVFAAFMCNLIVDGSVISSGIILLDIVDKNKERITTSEISWIVGIIVGFLRIAGPFVSLLANNYGFRITSMSGSVLSSSGYILIYIFCNDGTPNIIILFLCYGVMVGIGFSFIYVPAVVTVGFYFKKKRALATGIAVCGSGVGTFLYPPMTTYLNIKFGWPITVLVHGIIVGASVIFGYLYKPLKPLSLNTSNVETGRYTNSNFDIPKHVSSHRVLRLKLPEVSEISTISNTTIQNSNQENDESNHESVVSSNAELIDTFHSTNNVGDSKFLQDRKNSSDKFDDTSEDDILRNISVTSTGYRKILRLKNSLSVADTNEERNVFTLLLPDSEEDITQTRVYRVADKNTLNSPFNMNSLFYSGTLKNIQGYDEMEEGLEWEATPVLTRTSTETETIPSKKKCKCECRILRKMLDISLLKSWTFLLLTTAVGINALGFFTPFIYLTELVMDISAENSTTDSGTKSKGKFTPDEASTLISIIGVTNTISRIFIGGIADKLGKNILLVHNIALTLGGLITITVPFLEEYYLLAIYSGLFGIAVACYVSLRSIILVQLLGLAKLTNAFGLLLLFQGIFALLGSPLVGFLHEETNAYNLPFYVAGIMFTMSGVLCYPLHYVNNWEIKRKTEEDLKKLNRPSALRVDG